ncbi:MAG: cupin domain-containing protein, partial [Eubacteriales bacterium]
GMIIKKKDDCRTYIESGIQEIIGKRAELGSYERFSITKVFIENSSTDQVHYHKHSDELYYVTKGTGILVVNDVPYPLQAGDCVLVEHGEKHYIKSSDSPLACIVICSPAWDENDCIYV